MWETEGSNCWGGGNGSHGYVQRKSKRCVSQEEEVKPLPRIGAILVSISAKIESVSFVPRFLPILAILGNEKAR